MSGSNKRPNDENLDDSFDMPFKMTIVSPTQQPTAVNAQTGVPRSNSLGNGGNEVSQSFKEIATQFHALLKCVKEINAKVDVLQHLVRVKDPSKLPRSGSFSSEIVVKEPSRGAIMMLNHSYKNKERDLEDLIKSCNELGIDHIAALANMPSTIMTPELSQIPPAPPKAPVNMRPPLNPSQLHHNRPMSNVVASNNVHPVKHLPKPIPSQQSTSTAVAPPTVRNISINAPNRPHSSSAAVVNSRPTTLVQQSQQSQNVNAAKSVLNLPTKEREPKVPKKYERGETIMLHYQVENYAREIEKLKSQLVSQGSQIQKVEDLRKQDAAKYRKQVEEIKQQSVTQSFRANASMNVTVQETIVLSPDSARMPPPTKHVLPTKPVQLGVSSRFPNSSFRKSNRNSDADQLFHHDSGPNRTFVPTSSQVLAQTDFFGSTQSVKPPAATVAKANTPVVEKPDKKDAETQMDEYPWILVNDKEDFVDDLLALTLSLPRERFDLQKMEMMAAPTSDQIIQRCRPKPDPAPAHPHR